MTDDPADVWGSLDATALAEAIRAGRWTAEQALDAALRRLDEIRDKNAVIAWDGDEARKAAGRIDALIAAIVAQGRRPTAEEIGPLAGVPMTVKDCYDVVGLASTFGLDHRVGQKAPTDDPLVRRLRDAGAVIVGKTNVAQLLLYPESDNPPFGRTLHPSDNARTPGGSSGGEATVVAMGAVPVGLGGDYAGSLRIPAHFCGVQAMRPTALRLPTRGQRAMDVGQRVVVEQAGPIARSVRDLELVLGVLSSPDPGDPTCVPVAMPAAVAGRPGVGVWMDAGVPVAPEVRRVINAAADALREAGHHVAPFDVPGAASLPARFADLTLADGGAGYRALLRGSCWAPQTMLLLLAGLPRWLLRGLAAVLRLLGQPGAAAMAASLPGPSRVRHAWEATLARDAFRDELLATLRTSGVSVLISPPFALPALRHGDSRWSATAAAFGFLASYLGWPAGVVRFGTVQAEPEPSRPWDLVARMHARTLAESTGLPVGVQVIGPPWADADVLAVLRTLEAAAPPP